MHTYLLEILREENKKIITQLHRNKKEICLNYIYKKNIYLLYVTRV